MESHFPERWISRVSCSVQDCSLCLSETLHKDNPNGAECYGLSQSAMVSWIKDFSNTYEAKTGR